MTERGSASLELALSVGLLIIPAVVVVMSFAPWLESRALVRAAAAEAARTAVLAEGDPTEAGRQVVADMAAGRGFDAGALSVTMCGGVCVLSRDTHVTATVTAQVPLVQTPWGPVGGVTVTATHAEPVDAYRSLP